jgi:hypothetical protein
VYSLISVTVFKWWLSTLVLLCSFFLLNPNNQISEDCWCIVNLASIKFSEQLLWWHCVDLCCFLFSRGRRFSFWWFAFRSSAVSADHFRCTVSITNALNTVLFLLQPFDWIKKTFFEKPQQEAWVSGAANFWYMDFSEWRALTFPLFGITQM